MEFTHSMIMDMETDDGHMNSAREFMEFYLSEKAELEAKHRRLHRRLYGPFEEKFIAPDYLNLYIERRQHREENPETFISLEMFGDSARAITTGRASGFPKRYRYHLQRSAIGWQICEVEWECIMCAATGRLLDRICPSCDGAGWRDPLKPGR